MKDRMYIFEDLYNGGRAIFSSEEALKSFMKEYGTQYFNDFNEFPEESENYIINHGLMNPTYDEWNSDEA